MEILHRIYQLRDFFKNKIKKGRLISYSSFFSFSSSQILINVMKEIYYKKCYGDLLFYIPLKFPYKSKVDFFRDVGGCKGDWKEVKKKILKRISNGFEYSVYIELRALSSRIKRLTQKNLLHYLGQESGNNDNILWLNIVEPRLYKVGEFHKYKIPWNDKKFFKNINRKKKLNSVVIKGNSRSILENSITFTQRLYLISNDIDEFFNILSPQEG